MEEINKRLGEVLKNSLEVDKYKFIKAISSICDSEHPKDLCGLSIKDYVENISKPLDILNLILTSDWKEVEFSKPNIVLNSDIHFDPFSIRLYSTETKLITFTSFVDLDDLHPNTRLYKTNLLDNSGYYLAVNSEDVCPKSVKTNTLVLVTINNNGKEVLHTLVTKKYRFISDYILSNKDVEPLKNNPYIAVDDAKELGVKAIKVMV
jgi:hypothetical protein